MTMRMTVMAVCVSALFANGAYAADRYFADIKTGGDMDGYAFNVVKTPSIAAALKALLGKEYKALTGRIETAGLVERTGDVSCGSGLKPHSGGEDEAIFCVNHATGDVQAGIMKAKKIALHTGKAAPYPQLKAWQARIKEMQARFPSR